VSKHPYQALPEYTRWSRAVAQVQYANVDPVLSFPFQITKSDKVATAGSCFAQHIARHLKKHGFNYFVTEPGHPIGDDAAKAKFNYGTFSARYGNIYTGRQLLQMYGRAYGMFEPQEEAWRVDGRFIDPFRPDIQPGGYESIEDLQADRAQHLSRVREMFETCDVFVFTLGLTEHWYCKADGAALPLCPGVAGGTFDEDKYGFANQSSSQVLGDMREFLGLLRRANPKVRVILTVSPVPLAATALSRHVLVSTTYSKAALRVACEELTGVDDSCAYFPSYEIITGSFNRGLYFAHDLRSVTEEGVAHVMRLFLRHVADTTSHSEPVAANLSDSFVDEMNDTTQAICEENLIEASMDRPA
jgi:hypothetical protein